MVTPSRSFTTSAPCEPRGRRLMQKVWAFVRGCLLLLGKGSKLYYAWLSALMVLIAIGVFAYANQLYNGLIVTAMRDQVSWGFYISNFTFTVGVAAAAILLVIPASVYHWKPIKENAILHEILAGPPVGGG